MATLFLFSVALVLYTYFLYPLLLILMGMLSGRVVRKKDDLFLPTVSLIISAYNEERVIRKKMENSLALDYPRDRLEIIVASEATDRTNEIVKKYEGGGVTLRAFEGRMGKSATLHRVVPSTRGELIVFSDANGLYHRDALRKLVRNFSDPKVGCAVGNLQYQDSTQSVGAQGEKTYWAYDLFLRHFVDRLSGFIPGINGTIFAIRKALYFPFSEDRGDDYELCTRIAIRGHSVVAEQEAIAEEEASETTRQQFRRKSRLVRWNVLSTLLLLREAATFKRWKIVFQLVSHRLMRYSVPFWLILALLSSAFLAPVSSLFKTLFALQAGFYILSLSLLLMEKSGFGLPKFCMVPSYFLMVNSAAMVGVVSSLSRGQSTTWQKQR